MTRCEGARPRLERIREIREIGFNPRSLLQLGRGGIQLVVYVQLRNSKP